MSRFVVLMALSLAVGSAEAQVRQATPADTATPSVDGLKEVPSPMLIDIWLGAGTSPTGKPRKAFNETPAGATRAYNDATGYVCDKARVGVVLLRREEHRGNTRVTATAALSTEWLRQHVNLTTALMSDGKEVKRQRWDDLVIGATKGAAVNAVGVFAGGIGTSNSKAPTAEWEFTGAEWDALWSHGAPTLRVILEIPKEEKDED
jgi:hypothetical protein